MTDESIPMDEQPASKGRQGARWGQERRLEFIDYRLRWDAQINRSSLTDFFGISVPQASLDLTEYTKLAPENLEYDTRARVYRATSAFKSVFKASSLERYLDDLLRVTTQPETPYGSFLGWHSPVSAIPRLGRRLDADVVGTILRAIRELRSVDVTYRSMTEPDGSQRELTPHALVHDGYRWHTRAYCHKRKEFRDFLLSRIVSAHEVGPDQDRGPLDTAWNRQVDVIITPHPELSAAQRRLIESDYAMVDAEVHLQCRRALLHYLLFQLNLTPEQTAQRPEAVQLAVKNKDEVYALLQR